jgi:hypothetical protein
MPDSLAWTVQDDPPIDRGTPQDSGRNETAGICFAYAGTTRCRAARQTTLSDPMIRRVLVLEDFYTDGFYNNTG